MTNTSVNTVMRKVKLKVEKYLPKMRKKERMIFLRELKRKIGYCIHQTSQESWCLTPRIII